MDEPMEYISILPTGLDDKSLLGLKENPFSTKLSLKIQKLLEQIAEQTSERNEVIVELITEMLSFSPTSRCEYIWYLKFTAIIILLKGLPMKCCAMQGNLLTNLFNISTSLWDCCPILVNYFATGLYNVLEDDSNMVFVTNQIENRSPLGFYVSLTMLWKSIYRCIGEEKDKFMLYPPNELIAIIAKMDSVTFETDFGKFQLFLLLISKLTNLLFHRKSRTVEFHCYEEFFLYDVSLITVWKHFLESTLCKAEEMFRKDKEIRYMMIIEFLQTEISDFDTPAQISS